MKCDDFYTYKLYVYYKDSKVVRHFYFESIFSLYRFMYKQLKKPRVDNVKVVKI